MSIIITGANGLLGSELRLFFDAAPPAARPEVLAWDLPGFDITRRDRVRSAIKTIAPGAVIHLAAMTDVDRCEVEPDAAHELNTRAVETVVDACRETGAVCVYLSTDYVFDGQKGSPYVETDRPNPLSRYGRTKLEGERIVEEKLEKYFIVRTAGLYGRAGKNFVDTILKAALPGGTVAVVSDQIVSPTYARDLAPALALLAGSTGYGVYHVANDGWCSWFEFARATLQHAGLPNRCTPIATSQSGRRAPRPPMSALDCGKFERAFKKRLRPWNEALADYLDRTR